MNAQLVVRLPETEKRLLMLRAKSEGVSVGEIARKALREFLSTGKRKLNEDVKEKKTLGERLLEISARYKDVNGPSDLSSNYKEYLYGKYSKFAKQGKVK